MAGRMHGVFIVLMVILWVVMPQPVVAQPFMDISANLTAVTDCSLAWGDYDGDNDLDLAIAGADGWNGGTQILSSRIYRNDGTDGQGGWIFTDIEAGLTPVTHCSLAWGDYDGDDDLDLAIAGDSDPVDGPTPLTKIYRNDNGTFVDVSATANLLGMLYCSLAWADYDGDDDLDLAIAGLWDDNEDPVAKLYRNDGSDTFTDMSATVPLGGVYRCSLAWGDYDGEHGPDLAIAGIFENTGSESTTIYRNNGDGTFTDMSATIVLTGVWWASLAWGDYDNDSDLDLAVAGKDATLAPVSTIYRNDGTDGQGGWFFTNIEAGLTGVWSCSLAWGDLHNDGQKDLAITGLNANGERTSRIYRYDGNDTFTNIGASLVGVSNGALAWGDYDDDNDLDLTISGMTASTMVSRIYRNDGLCGNPLADSDADGTRDCFDNCLDIPNGPTLGTCTAGATGTCTSNTDCDTSPGSGDGVCSMNQENADGDSFGDACDDCPMDMDDDQDDFDDDGVGDACDMCPGTPPGAVIDPTTGCIPNPADFDRDGLVDEWDLMILLDCVTGPTVLYDPQQLPFECEYDEVGEGEYMVVVVPDEQGIIPPDLQGDGDVDQLDFGLFQRCIVYDNNATDPNCAD